MIDMSFYHQNGYQIIKKVFPRAIIEKIRQFLEAEKDKSLELIRKSVDFKSLDDLISKISSIFNNEEAFKALDPNLKNMLCGHFDLETRLNPILHSIPKTPIVQEIYHQILPNQEPRMHLPPTARFVLPRNIYSAVPAHQDISYNKHVEDFFVIWVPYCKIDDECGGVIVHKDTGSLPEQLSNLDRKFWLQGIPDLGYEKIHCKMDAGDALLLNKWVIHESAGNTSNRIRYSSDFRFFCGHSSKHYLDMNTWKTVAPSLLPAYTQTT